MGMHPPLESTSPPTPSLATNYSAHASMPHRSLRRVPPNWNMSTSAAEELEVPLELPTGKQMSVPDRLERRTEQGEVLVHVQAKSDIAKVDTLGQLGLA